MVKKLYITGIMISPIIALYGLSPLYIFEKINSALFIELLFILTLNIFVNWVVLIQLITRYPKLNNFYLFIISYFVNLLTRLIPFLISLITKKPVLPPIETNYMAYPVITSLAVNIIILIIIKSIISAYQKLQAEQKLQELQIQNTEAQKQLLIQQFQPHFLFNSLSTLKSLISIDTNLAERYTLKLSDFLRYSIQSNQMELISLEKELAFTKDYIELQKMRYDDTFEYKIEISPQNLQRQLPIFALQTLVENIFKHNQFTEKSKLTFSIKDNGDAISVNNSKKLLKKVEKNNTGLINLNKRYEIICGKSVTIEENESSFSVTIPLIFK